MIVTSGKIRSVGKSEKYDRWRGALWGMFVGDALAMPVHWYYEVAALRRDFGVVHEVQPHETWALKRTAVGQTDTRCVEEIGPGSLARPSSIY